MKYGGSNPLTRFISEAPPCTGPRLRPPPAVREPPSSSPHLSSPRRSDLLTHPYLTMTLSLVSTPLRRRILYCQRSMLCLCRSCTGEDRLRAMPSCTVLATEQQLAAEVLEIYASVDVEKPRSLPTEMRDRLEALRRECEATLGEAHWATQATRRLGLMQEYEQVRRSGDEGALAAWEAQMRLCEAFVDRTLAALESTTEEQPQAEEDGGGAEPVAWDASGEQEDAWEDAGQFLRTAGRPLRVCAWQDALAPESLDALAADAAKLRELVGDETFWISAEETRGRDPLTQALHPVEGPRCTLERLAADVLRFHAARGAPREVTGCEWWVQIRRPDGDKPGIGLHWDSDEVHADGSGEHVPPWSIPIWGSNPRTIADYRSICCSRVRASHRNSRDGELFGQQGRADRRFPGGGRRARARLLRRGRRGGERPERGPAAVQRAAASRGRGRGADHLAARGDAQAVPAGRRARAASARRRRLSLTPSAGQAPGI